MASSFSDLSSASITSSQSASSALSSVSEGMSRCSLAEQTRRNEEALLEHAKDFLRSQRDRIDSECDALQVLPFLSYELQEQAAREEIKQTRNREGREAAMDMLLDLVLRLQSLPLVRQLLVTIAKRNPRVYLEGTTGWNSLPEFKKIVPERIYYLDMLLSDVPADHQAWRFVFAELEECANNPLLNLDWMMLALLNEFDEHEMSDHGIVSMPTFWNYWLNSRRQPTLAHLLKSLLKMGLPALAECLGLDSFQLSSQEVSNLMRATQPVPDAGRLRTGVPEPRAGPLPGNSTMLHDKRKRVKTFSAIAAKMARHQDVIMRALAFDMDVMAELRDEHRGKSRACSEAMLDAWYRDSMQFEPLVEHLLFALKQAGHGALAADVQDIYPECHAARSAYKDQQRDVVAGDRSVRTRSIRLSSCSQPQQSLCYLPMFSVLAPLSGMLDNEKDDEHDWRVLARHLGLSADDIQVLARQQRNASPSKYVIGMWSARGRTRQDLHAFLEESGMYDEACIIAKGQ